MTVSATYTVVCNGCGLIGPSDHQSPGNARRTAKRDGWTTVPGQRDAIDLCPNCQTPKETQP